MEEMIIAKKEDWETMDMPQKNDTFILKRKFTPGEMKKLRYGNIPREMEEKWFWYMEGNTLYAHRSWTGTCVFIVEIEEEGDRHRVTYNCDKDQVNFSDKGEAEQELKELLSWWAANEYDNEWRSETGTAGEGAKDLAMIRELVMEHVYLDQEDITELECECIVNAANKSLLGGGGVDGAIHRAAGPKLLEECRSLHGCDTGEAKITKGYNLPAKYVIHTVGPIYSGKPSDETELAACYQNSLDLAMEHGLHSIAFPAISTGVYGYPLEAATDIAVQTVVNWLCAHADYRMDIIFCSYDARAYEVYEACLSKAIGE